MSDAEVAYWRTLAEERGRALDALQARVCNALALAPEEHLVAFATALSGAGWSAEPERMQPLFELVRTDVDAVLRDLWARVEADRNG